MKTSREIESEILEENKRQTKFMQDNGYGSFLQNIDDEEEDGED